MKTVITDNTAGWLNTTVVQKGFEEQLRLAVRREMMVVESENTLLQFVADLVKNDPEFKGKYAAFRAARLMGLK